MTDVITVIATTTPFAVMTTTIAQWIHAPTVSALILRLIVMMLTGALRTIATMGIAGMTSTAVQAMRLAMTITIVQQIRA